MPEFNYTARNRQGEIVTNTVEASSREALGQTLRQQGLLPTGILQKKKSRSWADLKVFFGHVSLLEKLTFIKNLGVTLKAGLPASKALGVVSQQLPNPYFKKILSEVAHGVESGKSLSEGLASYPRVFSAVAVNMIKVGEESGNLEQTLGYLSRQMTRDHDLLRKTRGALLYPALILVALVVIGYLMFTFVLPKLTATFADFNAELPLLTVVIVKMVDIFSRYSYLVLIGALAFFALFWYWHRTKPGRAVLHRFMLTFPVIKSVVKKMNMARFTIVFSSLLKSGMPIVDSLTVTSRTMTNIYYQQALADASEKVKIGVDLVSALSKYPKLFTPMVVQMIQVGEESGTMETILEEVAAFYEAEVDDTVKNLSSIIEPVLVLVIGAVVALLAVGLILPIYNLGQSI